MLPPSRLFIRSRAGDGKMERVEKPMAMLEAALDAARDRPRASASIAAVVGVGAILVLMSSKKVHRGTAVHTSLHR